MSPLKSVAIVLGSLRPGAYSRLVAQVLIRVAPPTLAPRIVGVGDLPLFNDDQETMPPPAAWTVFRDAIRAADAVLFVTPEYNRSIPAAMKNALDIGSSPSGQSVWDGKPGAVISLSIGGTGGLGAHHHLRQALVSLNVPTLAQPEVYLGEVDTLFDEVGDMIRTDTQARLTDFMVAYGRWVEAHA